VPGTRWLQDRMDSRSESNDSETHFSLPGPPLWLASRNSSFADIVHGQQIVVESDTVSESREVFTRLIRHQQNA
jgi:hypothetical protein